MGRLSRCDDYGTVRVDRYLFIMLDSGFGVYEENFYGIKSKGVSF